VAGRRGRSRGLLRQAEALARMAVPAFYTAVAMVLAAAPTGVPGLVAAVALPQVVFWSVFRPGAMSPPVAFALGLLLDLLTFAPLGGGILTLLLAHGLAVASRRVLARQGGLLAWAAFIGFAAGAAAFGWLLMAVLSLSLPPVVPALHQAVLTAALWPAFAFILGRMHAMMLRAEEAA
jgi:rod shape-determining protein MreD